MKPSYRRLTLKPGKEKRILQGEFWIYAGEIADPLDGFQPGEPVMLLSSRQSELGVGYVNPLSTIAFRLLCRDPETIIDGNLLQNRIQDADKRRRSLRPQERCYRMVYSEADFLPGLVVDRYDSHLVVQITTAGMERLRPEIFSVLEDLHPDAVLIEKAIRTPRAKEGLDEVNRIVKGDSSVVRIEINGVKIEADLLGGQKTGFFLDQRDNYRLLDPISRDAQAVDAFAYAGAWGLHALQYGAKHAEFIEISGESCSLIGKNAALNEIASERYQVTCADAFQRLKELSRSRGLYDLVVLDPPAFVKSKHKVRDALRGYKEINLRALHMLRPGGYLISCSCSHFLKREDFLAAIQAAAADAQRRVKLIEYRGQPYDHAILLPMEHGDYLKCALFSIY